MDGTPFGRYRLVELLARGGMGEVWRAHDTAIDRAVALKVLPPNLADDQDFQERFRREAKAAAGLDEPHIVPIHDFGEIDGRLYVTMRLIKGRDLQHLLDDGPLSPCRAVRIIEQAHDAGLVHRDVKPTNILIAKDDFAYLIDFGIARAAGETTLTNTGTVIGTWAYMAPERLNTGRADARTDVYALACVLYESLTGQRPYPGDSFESQITGHLTIPPPRPSVIRPGVPAEFDTVIAKGMAKDPDHRHPTALKLAEHARSAISARVRPPVHEQLKQPISPPWSEGAPTQWGGAPPPEPPQPMIAHFNRPQSASIPPPAVTPHAMPYQGGTSARPTSPEDKLASRRWRLLNSWWILPPVLSLGFLSWLGFLVAAIRTGKRKYWIFSVIYSGMLVLAIAMVETSKGSLANTLSPIPIFAAWLWPTVHAAIVNREYLRTLALKNR
ncbi:serine/threonine protein kinase [Mycobacterium shimoidei]|nr:serine/threonine protein kinase [Mycobacterium shimoidei]